MVQRIARQAKIYNFRSQFSEVYFRTQENIYLLDRQGRLIDANDTERHKGEKMGAVLDRTSLKNSKLTVGEPFEYQGRSTSRIVEIVATNERMYPTTEVGTGQKSTILQDF